MKNIYKAYTKVMMETTYYFVKQFVSFPDLKDVPDVLENYGMHTDFEQACKIAKIEDKNIRAQLLEQVQQNEETAKVIQMNAKIITVAQ
jgi:hypothetical protein